MKLAISNIAWTEQLDEDVYRIMKECGFKGLEIAPTRILPNKPYERLDEIKKWYSCLKNKYEFEIPSMQSIWYGRSESLWENTEDRKQLLEYTKEAIRFANSIECKNLVFGSPRNRFRPDGVDEKPVIDFFEEIGEFAKQMDTCIAMEANPTIYNTNYVTTTDQAVTLIEKINSEGFQLNYDLGTVIHNEEEIGNIQSWVRYINHVHISEPGLEMIKSREMHETLFQVLSENKYEKYISIEMKTMDNIEDLVKVMQYISLINEKY